MERFIKGYFSNRDNFSKEHIFVNGEDQPLCHSTPYKNGSFVKTSKGNLSKKFLEEMCQEDSLVGTVTCSKCKRMLKNIVNNNFETDEFWL